MKRFTSLKRRRNRSVRPQLTSVYGPQCLEDRSLMALVADGGEFLVNSQIAGDQHTSDAAAAIHSTPEGDYLVVFGGAGPGDDDGVFTRRYNAAGTPLTAPLLVNGTTAGHQGSATAALGAGRAVVVWSGRGEGDAQGIFAGIFSGAGNSSEIAVNVTKAGIQDAPAVAMAADGSFVVAWSGPGAGDRHGIFMRQFSANGNPLTGEIRVNADPVFLQRDPSIAMHANGQFVVTWASLGQDGSSWGIVGRRFSATGVAQGGEIAVNSTTQAEQTDARASMADDGSFVVAWASQTAAGSGWTVFAQRFDANGSQLGGETRVNTAPLVGKPELDVASAPDGRYVVTWATGTRVGNGPGVFGQAYLADGTPDGGEFRVNSTRMGLQVAPSVSLDRFGNAVFAWSGMGAGDASGVFATLLETDRDRSAPVVTASLTSTVAADGSVREVSIGGTLSDTVNAVTQVQVNLDGGAFVDVLAGADLRGSYQLTPAQLASALGVLPGGQHTIGVRAEDEEGNLSAIVNVAFTLDVAPSIVAARAEDNGLSTTDGITTLPTISGNITDLGPVTTLRAGIDGGAMQNINTDVTDHRGGFVITQATLEMLLGGPIADGQHTVTVQATDAKGDTSTPAQVSFTLDRAAPTVVSPLADLTFFEDTANIPLDLTGLFTGDNLIFSIAQNTAPGVVQVAAQGSSINLDFVDNRSGQAQVTVRATKANGLFVEDSFFVDVVAQPDDPTVVNQMTSFSVAATAANRTFNLGGAFGDTDQLGTLVRFDLANNLGSFGLELFDGNLGATPITAQNFISYASNGRYTNSIVHRSVPGFIVQGGGYKFESTNTFSDVNRQAEIQNEPGISNTRGTIAMAKLGGDPNSATSEFFFNLGNNNDLSNANSLDNQNGGFTAFGRVLGNGMQLIDNIASLTPRDLSARTDIQGTRQVESPANSGTFVTRTIKEVLAEIPLNNFTNADATANAPVTGDNVLRFSNISVDPLLTGGRGGDGDLTLTVSSSQPSVVAATINNKRLTLDPIAAGTTTITVRATDSTSRFVEMTFTVTVTGSALMLAGGDETPIPTVEEIASFNPRPLSPQMQDLVRAAVARFSSAGVDAALLSNVNVQLADLPGSLLGVALADQVWLDADAAGHEWFLDPSPADDLEFISSIAGLVANSSAAEGKIDLLTAIAHELGHALGLPDIEAGDSLMSESLGVGVRRLPAK